MQFVRIDNLTNRQLTGGSSMQRFETMLRHNINSALDYYRVTPKRFDNSHYLSRLLGNLSSYFGMTPEQTHSNVDENIRYIANLFDIAALGTRQSPQNVLFGKDLVFMHSLPVTWTNEGFIRRGIEVFRVFSHDQTSLRLEDYLSEDIESYSLMSVDLPLMAASYHQEQLLAKKNGDILTTHQFLTKYLISESVIGDIFSLSILNRLSNTAMGLDVSYDEYYRSVPYAHRDTNQFFAEALNDYRDYFDKCSNLNVEHLFSNLPLFDKVQNNLFPLLDDSYSNELMFYNAAVEVKLYRQMMRFNEGFDLSLNNDAYENRLNKLLANGRYNNLTRHLDKDTQSYFNDIISR